MRLALGELGTSTQTTSSFGIFFLGFFFCGLVLAERSFPPLERKSILPLVTPVLITTKGAEPPISRHIGVIGALVLILPSETVYDKLSSS